MTNKELQAYLTRFPEEVEVVWPILSTKDKTAYTKLEEDHIKLRRLFPDVTKTWFTYSANGKEVVLSIGE